MPFRLPAILLGLLLALPQTLPAAEITLFDGTTFNGWEGATGELWRIDQGCIVVGRAGVRQPENNFLATTREFGDFDLQLSYQSNNNNNGGIQFRSQRVPNSPEVSGYQADFRKGGDGDLYDEARRRKMLATPKPEVVAKLGLGAWNRYRILAEGPRIQLWVNGIQTVDYTEADPAIPRRGIIALQIHKNAGEIRYRDLVLKELTPAATP